MDNNLRILIVEDEFITLDLLKDYVIELGYHVSGDAINAEEAISVLEKNETDLVLLDINLTKEKDGIWIAEQINTKYKIPFIFISAYSDAETIKKAAFWHPSAYLVKPVKKIRKTHTFARSAQSLLAYHIKAGNIVRPDYCEECGLKSKIEGAHKDYSKPLDVRWLCRPCHVKWDKKDPKNATYVVDNYTGKKATLELSGQTYEELKIEREKAIS
jgi:CheY-like chemotaxis protein